MNSIGGKQMGNEIHLNRRGFLRTLGLTIAATQLGIFRFANAQSREINMQTMMNERRGESFGSEIRPFSIHIPDEALSDLRKRITSTRWPDKETVADQSQGAQLSRLEDLVRYWGSGYDWRKAEATLNALPQFMTNIDGTDIYFIHVRSKHEKALPLLITHGWPGSVFEFIKTIGPLTDPTAFGGKAE